MPFETNSNREEGIVVLKDTDSGTEARIFLFGALLNAFCVKTGDTTANIIDGFSSPADARLRITDGFRSAKLSPFVCRLRGGNYSFEGTDYHITGHFLNGHAIHGLLFAQEYLVQDSGSNDQEAFVVLTAEYRGSDMGYPFPFHITIEWKLGAGNTLSVTTCLSHKNAHAIPYTDGWHPYFTLGETVDDCTLQFDSRTQLEYDAELLPTGERFTDTRFEKGISLKGIEIDNSFVLEGTDPVCRLSNKRLELTIRADAAYPILQLYIPPHRKSIAIENLSGPPDNFNNHMNLLLLSPGEERAFTTSYSVRAL
ncbi:aldose 1-epimerase [Sediminibacterium soli]|uniref:aldose 1-epimerase n=1 Tax=Sediminibacterium soli TaxID=2698829 RepID=UPI00137A5CF3|nr:aldose 1-epimerase [Sediminibacterium soli]NCI47628.1 aldose 1-epimerase [Sediminibacterium soli]